MKATLRLKILCKCVPVKIRVTTGVKEQLKSIKCQNKSQNKYHSHKSLWNLGEIAQLKQRRIFYTWISWRHCPETSLDLSGHV